VFQNEDLFPFQIFFQNDFSLETKDILEKKDIGKKRYEGNIIILTLQAQIQVDLSKQSPIC